MMDLLRITNDQKHNIIQREKGLSILKRLNEDPKK